MTSERRIVEVAQGHRVTVYRTREPAARPGFVRVVKSHRPPFEIPEQRWNEAEVSRG